MALTLVSHDVDITTHQGDTEMIVPTSLEHQDQDEIEDQLEEMNASGSEDNSRSPEKTRMARLRQRVVTSSARRSSGRKKDDIWHFFTKQLGEHGKAVAVCNTCGKGVFPKAYVLKIHISKCNDAPRKRKVTPARPGDTVKFESASGMEYVEASTSFGGEQQRSGNVINIEESVDEIPVARFPPALVFGIVGGGVIAKSIFFPLIDHGSLDAYNVVVSGNSAENLEPWTERGCSVVENTEIFEEARVIVWGLRPHVFLKVIQELKSYYGDKCKHAAKLKNALHISLMTGITIEDLTKNIRSAYPSHFSYAPRIIRTVPSIGHRAGAGVTAFALGPHVEAEDRKLVELLFTSTGTCVEVEEGELNGFGALTSSGLGLMFPLMDAMCDGAVNLGIPRDVALKLVAQTMKGAAEFYLKEGNHPGALKDGVCSPSGSTIAGIIELEKIGLRSAFVKAIDAANSVTGELGKLV